MRWVLVEATGRILPEVDLDMAAWTVEQLTARGMEVKLNTRLESISDDVTVELERVQVHEPERILLAQLMLCFSILGLANVRA